MPRPRWLFRAMTAPWRVATLAPRYRHPSTMNPSFRFDLQMPVTKALRLFLNDTLPRAAAAMSTLALLAVPQPAAAAIDCWVDAEHPTTADQRRVADPAVAPMRQALQRVNAILHAQRELHELPRTRLRSSWQVGGQWDAPARSGSLLLRDHRESMWLPGRCDVNPKANRLGPMAAVVVAINAPTSFFESPHAELRDEQLQAWRELPATGQLNSYTLYGGHQLVFTRGGRLPWVAVTTAEYVDFTLRDLKRRMQEDSSARAGLPAEGDTAAREAFDESQVQKVTAGLRKVDPAAAEKMTVELRDQLRATREADARAARRKAAAGVDANPLQTMLRRVEAWRAGLSPQQLAAPALLGLNGLHDAAVPLDRYPRLVKPDPDFPWDRNHPGRPQMLKVAVNGGDIFTEPMQRVLQQLDLKALQALVD